MRKILSLFAAILFAGSMMADSYVLVTSTSDLAAGDQIIIVNTAADKAISTTQNTNNRAAVAVEVVSDAITPGDGVQIITLEASSTNWKLKVGDDQYLYAAASDNNYLKTAASATAGDNGVWKVEITSEGVATLTAQGDKTRNIMRYNPNTQHPENPLFSCYGSSSTVGTLVSIYKKSEAAPAVLKPTFSVAAGTYNEAKSIELDCATAGASIHYTIDGNDPTAESPVYSSAIVLNADGKTTIKAIAIKGEDKSAIASAEYTILLPGTFSSLEALVGQMSGKPVTVTFDPVEITEFYTNSAGLRKGVLVDVQDADDNDIEIYFSKKVDNVEIVVPETWGLGGFVSGTIVGTWTYYEKDAQWEIVPSADDWNWTQLTYTAPAVEAPKFTPAVENFDGTLAVTITCATEGAKIYYAMGSAWPADPTSASTEYTAPIEISETTYFKAIAIKDGVSSAVEGVLYTKVDKSSCADIYSMSKNDEVVLGDVVVTFVNGKNVWVRDNSGSMLLYLTADATWKAGDKLSGVNATVDIYNGVYELKLTAAQVTAVTATAGEAPAPEVLTAVATTDMNKYIVLQDIAVEGTFVEGTASNIDVTLGESTIVLRSNFKNAFTFEAGKKYDVVCVVTIYQSKAQLYFISASEHVATAIDNTVVEGKAVKRIENGMLIIEKNGVRYNALGQAIR